MHRPRVVQPKPDVPPEIILPELCRPVENVAVNVSHETDKNVQGRHSVLTHDNGSGLLRHKSNGGVDSQFHGRVCLFCWRELSR